MTRDKGFEEVEMPDGSLEEFTLPKVDPDRGIMGAIDELEKNTKQAFDAVLALEPLLAPILRPVFDPEAASFRTETKGSEVTDRLSKTSSDLAEVTARLRELRERVDL